VIYSVEKRKVSIMEAAARLFTEKLFNPNHLPGFLNYLLALGTKTTCIYRNFIVRNFP